MPIPGIKAPVQTGDQIRDRLQGTRDGNLLTDSQLVDVNSVSDVVKDLSGAHLDGEQHNFGLAQQVEVGHLTDAFVSEQMAEILRVMGGSGIFATRQYNINQPFDINRRTHSVFSAVNLHDHSNYNSMPGIGEISMIINGYYYRTRHNDYIMRKAIRAPSNSLGAERIYAPEIKASVLAKPTGVSGDTVDTVSDTQARYFKNIHTDNPEDVEMHLAYMEVWFEETNGESIDAGLSDRHADEISNLRDAYEQAKRYNSNGLKNFLENESFSTYVKYNAKDTGEPEVAYMNFRIMVQPVGTMADVGSIIEAPIITIGQANSHQHILTTQLTDQQASDLVNSVVASVDLTSTDNNHTHTYQITWDGSKYVGVDTNIDHQHEVHFENSFDGAVPYDKQKVIDGVVDTTNRFSIVKDQALLDSFTSNTYAEMIDTRMPRFTVEHLDKMCERCPGLDGEGAYVLQENPADPTVNYTDPEGGTLNASYYHRRYSRDKGDAAGRSIEDRGYNDPNLFVAVNTKTHVTNQVSYMIPLELIARSPIENWNPYQFPKIASRSEVEVQGHAGTQADPHEGYADAHYYYLTPYSFYADIGLTDPADTSGSLWIRSGIDAQPRRAWASGVYPFLPDLSMRIRYPVYPVYQDYSHESVRIAALERQVAAQDNRAIYLMKTTVTRDALTAFEGMRAFTEDGNAWLYTGGAWQAATAYTVSDVVMFMGDLTVSESLTFRTARNLLGIPYLPGTEV